MPRVQGGKLQDQEGAEDASTAGDGSGGEGVKSDYAWADVVKERAGRYDSIHHKFQRTQEYTGLNHHGIHARSQPIWKFKDIPPLVEWSSSGGVEEHTSCGVHDRDINVGEIDR